MPLSRRHLLGLGAVAAAGLLTSCDADLFAGRSPLSDGSHPPAEPLTRQPLGGSADRGFAGRPPPGRLYYGACVPFYRSLADWEAELGNRLTVNRSFFTPDEPGDLVVQARRDLRAARLPHVSIKAPGTWADVASGRQDRWLEGMFAGLARADGPVFLTLHHEPENDSGGPGMAARDFVAMQRRAVRRARSAAPKVTVVPVHQHWTFEPSRTDGSPGAWIVPEADVFGIDLYNPWSQTNAKPWRTFASKLDDVAPWIGATPVAVGEYGCRVDTSRPGRTAAWMREAFDYASTHNVVSMSYFNSRLNSPDGSWELEGESELEFARLLGSDLVARPGQT